MELIHDLESLTLSIPSCVTIGAFDGVHRGHQHLISSMVRAAHDAGRAAVVLTFAPHPGALLGRSPVAVLTTPEERAALIADMGVDVLVILRFTPTIAGTPAARFVRLLCRHLRMVELWVGPDFALGHRREGNVPFLRQLGKQEGFVIHVVEPLQWQGAAISSTRIRAALTAGEVEEANGCLGRPYRLTGQIVRGRGLGRRLGIPTANLSPPPERLIPANGVYVGHAHTQKDGSWPAVVNIGVRPTIAPDHLTVEAHLLDFDRDLYDQTLALDFIARLRDEQTFPSLNSLVEQIQRDIARAREVFRERGTFEPTAE